MKRRRTLRAAAWLILSLPLGGCYTIGSLQSSSVGHARQARYLAQTGQADYAWEARHISVSEQEEARRRRLIENAYIESEVLMQ
jgi:hypothetical protein